MKRACAIALVALCATACSRADSIAISHAWVRPPAPGLTVAAGYFDIANRGTQALELTGAQSDGVRSVEIHTHIHDGELMQMRQLDAVPLPAGETVSFAPGGLHLMLLGFTSVTSTRIPITLSFSDGSRRTVMFDIGSVTGEGHP